MESKRSSTATGATLIEYALLAVLVVIAIAASMPALLEATRSYYQSNRDQYNMSEADYLLPPAASPAPSQAP